MFPFTSSFTLSDLSLLVQVLAYATLLYAVYRRKVSIKKHGNFARISFYLLLPSVIYMLYSRSRGFTLPNYDSLLGVHILLGILSIILGILFVTNQWKWKGKKYMDLGILLWTGAFLLGVIIYLLLFGLIPS
jgi:uncharacterized membrane protein YozB (DUF420 family)